MPSDPVVVRSATPPRAVDVGADIVVAQGTEAGGHGGARGTMAFVPAVVDLVDPVPVLAAGGIADGRGVAARWPHGIRPARCGPASSTGGVAANTS